MALPFDRLNPSDKQILDSLKSQNAHLDAQTKVLHSLSSEILKQRKENTSNANKNAKDFQTLFGMMSGGFSEIKKYLNSGKVSGSTSASASFRDKGAQPDRGFFTNLFSKVFGPSKYQIKVMEEITLLRELSERQTKHLEFLAEQNTDGKRAKERELLAEAIARKMRLLGLGDGDGMGGGALSALGKALLVGIGGAIALLGRQITTGLKGLLAGIKLAFKALEVLFDKLFQVLPKFPPTAGPVPGQGPVGGPPLPPPGPPFPPPNSPPRQDQKRLPGPKGEPFRFRSRADGQPIQDVKPNRFSPGGGGRAIALALVALGAALGYKIAIEDEEKPSGSMFGGSVFDNDPTDKLLRDIDQQFEMKRQGVTPRDNMALGEALDIAGKNKFIMDPFTGQQITAEQFKKRYPDLVKQQSPEAQKHLDTVIEQEKLEEENLKKERERLEKEEKGLDLQEDYNSVLQGSIDSLDKFTDMVSGLGKAALKQSLGGLVDFLNRVGEISIQGQKLNLLPSLGTGSAKAITDATKLGEELVDYVEEKTKSVLGGGTNVVSTVNNNVNNGGGNTSLPPVQVDKSKMEAFNRLYGLKQ